MQKEERLERAKRSLERALSAKHLRDVSGEIASLLLNISEADARFADIGTNEHEIRAALLEGYLSQVRTLTTCAAAAVPQEGVALIRELGALMLRADEALVELNAKVDRELALFMEENDPFLKGMRESKTVGLEACAEIFAGLDPDELDLQFSVVSPPSGSIIETREEPRHDDDFVITVEDGGSVDLAINPS